MSFVPDFAGMLVQYLKREERQRVLRSLAVSVAPELWLSLEAAALLDLNRQQFGLSGHYDDLEDWRPEPGAPVRGNVPRWLIAAERRKVDIWVQDLHDLEPPTAIEFKVVHNNKNARDRIGQVRHDLVKPIPGHEAHAPVQRWGIVVLVYSHFYADQQGGYTYGPYADCQAFLDAFRAGLADARPGLPAAVLVREPEQVADLEGANFIEPGQGAAVYLALVSLVER